MPSRSRMARKRRYLFADDGDPRMRRDSVVNRGGEHIAIDGERRTARDACLVGRPEHDRPEEAHLGLQ